MKRDINIGIGMEDEQHSQLFQNLRHALAHLLLSLQVTHCHNCIYWSVHVCGHTFHCYDLGYRAQVMIWRVAHSYALQYSSVEWCTCDKRQQFPAVVIFQFSDVH